MARGPGGRERVFSHEHVKRVDAHTLAEPNASVRVLEKAGMEFAGAMEDPDVGEVWHWSVSKEGYRRGRSEASPRE